MSDIRATTSIGTPQFKTISSSVVVAADFDELTQDTTVDAYQIIARGGNLRWLAGTDPSTTVGNVWREDKQDTISRTQFLTMRWIAESDDVVMLVSPQEEIVGDNWFLRDAEVVKAQAIIATSFYLDGQEVAGNVSERAYVLAYLPSSEDLVITAGTPLSPTTYALNPSLIAKGFAYTDGSLVYTGTENIIAEIVVSFSVTSSVNNVVIKLFLGKNSVIDTATEMQRKIGTGADVGLGSFSSLMSLSTGDTIDLFVDTDIDATITLEKSVETIISI